MIDSSLNTTNMGKSKGKKRKAQGVGLPDWMQKLLALANNGQTITVSQIQKANISSKWSELAPQFDIFVDLTMARFDSFSIAPVLLPPSFHETTAEAAWRMQDVFQEQLSQNREKARLRTFEPVCPTLEKCCRVFTLYKVHSPNCRIIPRSDH